MDIKRGDIFYADLGSPKGSEQGGVRPVVIIQNDIGNKFSPTIIAAAITSKSKNSLPTHVVVHPRETGLPIISTILLEQVRTIDKKFLSRKVGHVDMGKCDDAIKVSLGLVNA